MGKYPYIFAKDEETTPVVAKEPEETWIVELAGRGEVNIASSKSEERTKAKGKIADYQKLYINDSLTFGFVNFLIHKICPGFVFVGDNADLVKRVAEWSDRVKFKITVEDIIRDIVVCGGSWEEPLLSSISIEGNRIINPATMDYIRDDNENVELDALGVPLGYIQDVNGSKRYWYKDRIEQDGEIIYKADENEDLRKRINYIKLISWGDSELGISFLQPAYRSAIIRTNLEDMVGESAFRGGGIVAYITGEPPKDVKDNLKRDLLNITSKNIFLLKDNIKLNTIPIPELEQRESLLYLLADFEGAGIGVPLEALVSGSKMYRGDTTAKMADLEVRITSYQERLSKQLEDFIIRKLLEKWKIPTDPMPVHIKFVAASPATQLTRARVIATLARRTLMRYDPELELYLRREIGVPTSILQKELDRWNKEGITREIDPKEKMFEATGDVNKIDSRAAPAVEGKRKIPEEGKEYKEQQ